MFVNPFSNAVTVLDGRVTVHDESAIASPAMDKLVYTAVFGEAVKVESGPGFKFGLLAERREQQLLRTFLQKFVTACLPHE